MSSRSKKSLSPAMISALAGGALVVALGGGFLWMDQLHGKAHDDAETAAYAASGPPCPAVTPAGLETNGPHLRHSFEYGDMTLSYAFGGADCAWIKGAEGQQAVCKFDSPGSVGVKLKGPMQLFTPGVGKSAAIVRQGETLSCVMIPRLN